MYVNYDYELYMYNVPVPVPVFECSVFLSFSLPAEYSAATVDRFNAFRPCRFLFLQ